MATWRSMAVALATATVLLTAGCSGSGAKEEGAAASTAPSAPTGQESLAAAPPAPGGDSRNGPAGQLALANDPNLGPIVTDSTGFTLYRFTTDGPSPTKSACEGDCAAAWPPVPADGAVLPAGLDASLMGSVTRADGSKQLALAGMPLYRFAKDAKPGQVSGDGVGGVWFAGLPKDKVPGLDAALGAAPGGTAPGGAGPETGGDAETGADDGAAEGKTPAPEGGGALPGLSTVQDPELGEIVVDAKGRTLYRFTKDTDWPMTTACTGACLEKWKPAALVAKNDVKGIDPKLVIPFDRPDGKKQQTLDCWPLYWFTGDKPGEINGQGVGGTWFAVAPDGSLIKK
ncbi:SCO0930 family lipoprotein [Streptomyces lichenis]|uniref:SCO0930 family lipoprotein n=1 Tax=Streptomyces lichenis TaxID=2306967 RepID=A0ABT0IA74_9ACTN|nr:SCO0930 family lipoprotein [Streptomyces lichenis]MCK8678225.1 SCO0930 family lipoprotein [Streptomyces lichenis]